MGRYRGFSKNFKNKISSIYKVIDITSIKVHPDATGARRVKYWSFKKGLTTKTHAVCLSEKFALKIQLSAGNCYDAPEGKKPIESINAKTGSYLIMDSAYEVHEIRTLAIKREFIPVVPPKKNKKIQCNKKGTVPKDSPYGGSC